MKIGLLCNCSEDNILSINQDYVTYFDTYGDTVFIDPLSNKVKNVDLLVGIGGKDLNPLLYGQPYDPALEFSFPNRAYDRFDFYMLPKYLNAGIKVFGICRMFQRLAIGVPEVTGSLNPHVEDEQTSQFIGQPAHFVGDYLGNNMMWVNSTHHQTVKVLAPGLTPLLWGYHADIKDKKYVPGERRAIEAYRSNDWKHAGCQWHPERGFDTKPLRRAEEFVRNLITDLLNS